MPGVNRWPLVVVLVALVAGCSTAPPAAPEEARVPAASTSVSAPSSDEGSPAGAEPESEGSLAPEQDSEARQPWNEGRSEEELRAQQKADEELERIRASISPGPVQFDVPPSEFFPSVGTDVSATREGVREAATVFAEAVGVMVQESRYDSDVLVLPGRDAPVAYPRESGYIAIAATRRRGLAIGSDTFYRQVTDRVWTAVFTGSARGSDGRVVGFCYGVYVMALPGGEVRVGVEDVPITAMVPGTRQVPTRMRCMPGEDTQAQPGDLE